MDDMQKVKSIISECSNENFDERCSKILSKISNFLDDMSDKPTNTTDEKKKIKNLLKQIADEQANLSRRLEVLESDIK